MGHIRNKIDERRTEKTKPKIPKPPPFATGQSTQMIVGADDSTDSVILRRFTRLRLAGLMRLRLALKKVTPYIITADPSQAPLFTNEAHVPPSGPTLNVSRAFLDVAHTASAHSDPRRWALLYQLLWRHTRGGEKHLLGNAANPEVRTMMQWCKAVGRDIHKMHAFVRFRLVGTDENTRREQFVAWFEPGHRIVRLASPFFEKRFHGMD